MIQSNQLRVGNLVYKDYNKKDIVVIKAIHEGEMAFEPIELSPEILKKCGFEEGIGQPYWEINTDDFEFIVRIRTNNEVILQAVDLLDFSKPLKYLHQLQNLYFFLTEKELEVTPTLKDA